VALQHPSPALAKALLPPSPNCLFRHLDEALRTCVAALGYVKRLCAARCEDCRLWSLSGAERVSGRLVRC
jgi:hypothetical protein